MEPNDTENNNDENFVIDAIAMKRRIQEEIHEETKDMNAEELIAYFQEKVANSRFADFLSQPSSSTAAPEDQLS